MFVISALYLRKWGYISYHNPHRQYFLCETLFLNLLLSKKEQICSPYISCKGRYSWKWAQYAPLSDGSNRVTVCSQSSYEWEPSCPSCACSGPPCTSLECKGSSGTGPAQRTAYWIEFLHTTTVFVKKKKKNIVGGTIWEHVAICCACWLLQ